MSIGSFVHKLKNELAGAADAIIPGDQSSWHDNQPTAAGNAAAGVVRAAGDVAQGNFKAAGSDLLSRFGEPSQPTPTPQPKAAPIFNIKPISQVFNDAVSTFSNPSKAIVTGVKQATTPQNAPAPANPVTNPASSLVEQGTKLMTHVGQGLARVAPQVLVSVAQPGADAGNALLGNPSSKLVVNPHDNPILSAAFGKEPVTTYQDHADKFSQFLAQHGIHGPVNDAAKIATAPVLAGLDLFTGGEGGPPAEQLAKDATEQAVKKTLVTHYGEEAATKFPDEVVKAIATENNPDQINNILRGNVAGDVKYAGGEAPTVNPGTATEADQVVQDVSQAANDAGVTVPTPFQQDVIDATAQTGAKTTAAAASDVSPIQKALTDFKDALAAKSPNDSSVAAADHLKSLEHNIYKVDSKVNGPNVIKDAKGQITGYRSLDGAIHQDIPTMQKVNEDIIQSGNIPKEQTSLTGQYATQVSPAAIEQLARTATDSDLAKISDTNPELVQQVSRFRSENGISNIADPGKQRQFVTKVQTNELAPTEVRSGVQGIYDPISNKESLAEADAKIQSMGFDAAAHEALTSQDRGRLAQATRLRLSDQLQERGQEALKSGDQATADALFNHAIDILNKTAEHATVNGQDTQILAAYNRLTPEGVVRFAMKGIEDAKRENPLRYRNLKMKPGQAAALRERAATIQAMPEGEAKMIATYKMLRDIAKLTPSTRTTKLITLWKAGLLTGIKGQLGNQVGNASHLLLRKLADIPASQIDATIGLATGQRGKTFTLRGLISGLGEGFKAGYKAVRHGFDPASIVNNKYDTGRTFFSSSPLGKAAQAYTDTVFRITGAGDRPYYYATLRNSLADRAIAAAKTAKVPLGQRQKYIKNFIANPPEEALVGATADAQEAIFANDSAIGQALKGLKRGFSKTGSAGEAVAETQVPFTGVPSAIATAVVNFSPVGGVKAIYDALRAAQVGEFTPAAQRQLSEALGRAVTGTGVMWLGYQQFLDGKLTLAYPKDPQERALWQQEGKQPYSIEIGGKWRSLNYTGPLMALMGIGGQIAQTQQSGESFGSAALTGAGGAAQAIIGSSPLKGIQSGLDVVNDPERNAKAYLNSLAGSVVPTLVKDTSNATDDTKREANTPLETIKSRIPGVREGLNASIDEFGNPIQQDPGGIRAVIDPFKSTDDQTGASPLITELQRLQDAGQGITPSKQDANLTLGGVKVKLTPDQLNQYKQSVGQAVTGIWTDLAASPDYQALDDAGKNRALSKAKDAVTAATNAQFATEQNLGDVKKAQAVDGLGAAVLAGHTDPRYFTTAPGDDLPNELHVQQLQDSLAADENAGTVSTIEIYKRQKAIDSAIAKVQEPTTKQIAAGFSKDAVTLAGMSKADVNALVSSGQVDQSLVNEANAYKLAVKTQRPSTSSGKSGSGKAKKVSIKKGSSGKGVKVKMAKIKAPKVKAKKTKVTTVAKAKKVKLNLPKTKVA